MDADQQHTSAGATGSSGAPDRLDGPASTVNPVSPVGPARPRPAGPGSPEAVPQPTTAPVTDGVTSRGPAVLVTVVRAFGPVARWFAERHLSWPGLVGALVGLAAAMTPSLLPRPTLYLGFIAGVGAAVGYGAGVLIAWIVRRVGVPRPPHRVGRVAWRVLAIAGPVLVVVVIAVGCSWQDDVRVLVGEARRTSSAFLVGLIALIVFLAVLGLSRALLRLSRRVSRLLGRWIPAPAASLAGVVVVSLLVYWLAAGVLFRVVVDVADSIYSGTNAGTDDGVVQVTSPLR